MHLILLWVQYILTQVQNGNERVIAYASHTLTKSEKKWPTYDRELYAIVWAVREFRHYLTFNPFTILPIINH